jgi:hypothetical protein
MPLPTTVALLSQVRNRLDQLSREPCYNEAIVGLSDALRKEGYPRESANVLLNFAKRCAGSEYVLIGAYDPLIDIGDFSAALRVADELIRAYPASSLFLYWRARAHDRLDNFPQRLE